MTLTEFLATATEQLKQAGVDNPQLDARLLTCHALDIDRAQLLSQSQRMLFKNEMDAIDALLTRRAKRESVARITGRREFWGLEFGLNEATLEPRPDSETLVEAVLASGKQKRRILDLGTGTGCLLLALLHEMNEASGVGVDINPRAVEQAAQNALALGLEKRAAFRCSDWLGGLSEKFDLIVSNPPYIPASDIPALMPEVRHYDPLLSLDGGADGLEPYRLIIPRLKDFLNPGGIAAFEVGIGQASQVADFLQQSSFTNIAAYKDLGGIERCVTATRPD